ncbi:Hypothetical_protein [Hexamita inflata]|uniref:Hypothetical_protein n=1 Tax=Hexamita inflata TaxID=28002 RepID=A0AA86UIK6_9EUKA|nr:Hypothetical protein HINF_LOCUS40262 [Hexamita inflata]
MSKILSEKEAIYTQIYKEALSTICKQNFDDNTNCQLCKMIDNLNNPIEFWQLVHTQMASYKNQKISIQDIQGYYDVVYRQALYTDRVNDQDREYLRSYFQQSGFKINQQVQQLMKTYFKDRDIFYREVSKELYLIDFQLSKSQEKQTKKIYKRNIVQIQSLNCCEIVDKHDQVSQQLTNEQSNIQQDKQYDFYNHDDIFGLQLNQKDKQFIQMFINATPQYSTSKIMEQLLQSSQFINTNIFISVIEDYVNLLLAQIKNKQNYENKPNQTSSQQTDSIQQDSLYAVLLNAFRIVLNKNKLMLTEQELYIRINQLTKSQTEKLWSEFCKSKNDTNQLPWWQQQYFIKYTELFGNTKNMFSLQDTYYICEFVKGHMDMPCFKVIQTLLQQYFVNRDFEEEIFNNKVTKEKQEQTSIQQDQVNGLISTYDFINMKQFEEQLESSLNYVLKERQFLSTQKVFQRINLLTYSETIAFWNHFQSQFICDTSLDSLQDYFYNYQQNLIPVSKIFFLQDTKYIGEFVENSTSKFTSNIANQLQQEYFKGRYIMASALTEKVKNQLIEKKIRLRQQQRLEESE